jgi:hypothetical protein
LITIVTPKEKQRDSEGSGMNEYEVELTIQNAQTYPAGQEKTPNSKP